MKIIFLDFDGVITTPKSGWNIDNNKCLLIKEICDKTGAKIVISSSWRHRTVEETIKQNHLEDWILKDYVVGVTISLMTDPVKFEFEDRYCDNFLIRGNEIDYYIKNHNVENYVILDDYSDEILDTQKKHLVQTYSYEGISEKDVQKAINILS